ncbi:MAG: DUF1273 domain-containing protein [Butyrivibrio sp.]|nr:DUF1273 domain-containing protein [Butyrivibrio sp.]
MNTKEKTVCFSGHRDFHDPKAEIEKSLEAAIRQCIDDGAESFITGGALGYDTLAAWTVIRLREEYPQIKLVLALPCPPAAQTLKWKDEQKAEYEKIRELADEEHILSTCYTRSCMLDRNRFMVDNSYRIIHYLRSDRGGTRYTVNYAKKQGIELIGI